MQGLIQTRAFSYWEAIYGSDPRHVTVTSSEQLEEMVRRCQAATWLARDTETNGLRWDLHARAVGFVYSCFRDDGAGVQSYYVPFRHRTGQTQIAEDAAQRAEQAIQRDSRSDQIRWWWNLPFDKHILRREGVELDPARDFDAQIAARLYDENTNARLKDRAVLDLGDMEAKLPEQLLDREVARMATFHGVTKEEYRQAFGYSQADIFLAGAYAGRDGEFTLRLAKHYWDKGVVSYYSDSPRGPGYPGIWQTEQRLAHVLTEIEEWGLPVDRRYIGWLREQTGQAMEKLEDQIWDQLGHHRKFNLDSDEELGTFLTKTLRLELYKKTRTGQLSVDREVLAEFEAESPVLGLIKDRREARKISSTYTDSLLQWADAGDIIHGQYKQLGPNTGRASMAHPNMQNICSDSDSRAEAATGLDLEHGGRDPWSTRRAFPVRPGWARIYLDWSQIELRELADASGDPQLIDVYRSGGDIHDRTSMLIFGTKDKAKRRISKVANFGTAYGLTAPGLARQAKIPRSEAESFMSKFWAEYSGIDRFRKKLCAEARAHGGWIRNKFGRTRRVLEIMSHDEWERGGAERKIMASRIQGGAGDITKDAVVRVADRLQRDGLEARICGWIHDEIAIDVRPKDFARTVVAAKEEMEHFPDYLVPITAKAEYTLTDWSEKEAVPGL